MCGIVGILAFKSSIPVGVLERATDSLAHRGPDDSGTVVLKQANPEMEIGFGHRRLAIIDLSPLGHQPMHDPISGNWIVYNGEIYNFAELRKELEELGVEFKSHSDTEVILLGYRVWGESCVARLRGMFAFGLWDDSRKRLLLARDPMGIKPLYYYHSATSFVFASEVRAILQTGLVQRKADPVGVVSYLEFGSVCEPWTMIEGIKALPAGHMLFVENASIACQEYWSPLRRSETQASHDAAHDGIGAVKQLAAILREAVLSHLVSDVPVGVFLSGGIDSSALVAILSQSGVLANTFSLVFGEEEFNEAKYSRAIARRFDAEHHEIPVSQGEALAALPGALLAMDQPTIDGINTYLVSAKTRAAGLKVALSGLGADEMFGGYSNFRRVPRLERFSKYFSRFPGTARETVSRTVSRFVGESDRNQKIAELAAAGESAMHPYFMLRTLFRGAARRSLFLESETSAEEPLNRVLEAAVAECEYLDPVNRVSYLESKFYMRNTLLRDSDFMSMAHGLELRVPFLDQALVEACFRIPGREKMRGNLPKGLLLASLGVKLPEEIVKRPKRGFTLPFERWLRGEMRPVVENVLLNSHWEGMSISGEAVRQVWERFLAGKTSWSRPWSLFILGQWCERNN
jgi:asparagine synthase (glutamine-hydrolyzing)